MLRVRSVTQMGTRPGIISATVLRFIPVTSYLIMPSYPPHLIWSKGQTRCMRTSSKGRQGHIITHAFTTAVHSLPSCTIILPCSTDIPLSFYTVHPFCLWPSFQPHTSHIGFYYSLHQPLLLQSLHVSKLPQHTLLCSISQLYEH